MSGTRRVVGGQVSFLFKRDRLFVIGSQAVPNVAVSTSMVRLAPGDLATRATVSVRAAVGLPNAPVTTPGAEVVLPLIGDAGVLGYRLATPVTIDGGAAGRYLAYADPSTGAALAVVQLNEYATGTLLYHGVDRYPGRGYIDRPAPHAYVTIGGAAQITTPAGGVAWSPDGPVQVTTAVIGDYVSVVNKAPTTETAVATLGLVPNGQAVWDASASTVPQSDGTLDHEDDAQVSAYLDVNIVKDYVRDNIDPNMPTLDEQMIVYVNVDQACNAFFDGKALNFFHAVNMGGNGYGCENTGACSGRRLPRVRAPCSHRRDHPRRRSVRQRDERGRGRLPRGQHHRRSRHGPRLLPHEERGRRRHAAARPRSA